MASMPTAALLDWAAHVVGSTRADVRAVEGLHDGSSPWRLVMEDGATCHCVILRVAGWIPPQGIRTGAAALRVAEQHGLAAPRVLAADLDGSITGSPATVETALAGTSALPAVASRRCLQAAGAAIAKVHAVNLDPTAELPLRVHHNPGDDHPMERRWANLYRAVQPPDRSAVVQALSQLTGWSVRQSEQAMHNTECSPLLQLADERIRALDRPWGPTVLLHGDPWEGNMLWDGDSCVGLIDWKSAGVGHPGIDLGDLRLQVSIKYGADSAEHVLHGWQAQTGQAAPDLAYWDVVAALNTPAVLYPGLALDSRGATLDPPAETDRRDEFLRNALDELELSSRIPRYSRYQ